MERPLSKGRPQFSSRTGAFLFPQQGVQQNWLPFMHRV